MTIVFAGRSYQVSVVAGKIYIGAHPIECWPVELQDKARALIGKK